MKTKPGTSAAIRKATTANVVNNAEMVASFPTAPDIPNAMAKAKLTLLPSANAAAVIVAYGKPLGEQDIGALAASLSTDTAEMEGGAMTKAEAMLFGQAHALQAIFMNFSRRALNQEYVKSLEMFLRIALKAQNQCRMTLETLAVVKNPPLVFARQANINNGGQQLVNNGAAACIGDDVPAGGSARATNSSITQTELLETRNGQRMDTGAGSATVDADPNLEAVGAIHRSAHR